MSKVSRHSSFMPVTIVLETQLEVDIVAALVFRVEGDGRGRKITDYLTSRLSLLSEKGASDIFEAGYLKINEDL